MYGVVVAVMIATVTVTTVFGAVAATRGRPRRNGWFGFRTPRTMRSDAAWVRAQRAGWRRRVVVVPVYLAAFVVTVVSTASRTFDDWAVPVVAACGLAGIVTAVWSVLAAQRAADTA